MRHRPSSIGKSLAAFATVGSLLIAAAPSFGQDIKATPVASKSDGVTVNTNCHDYKPGELMGSAKCEIVKGGVLDKALAKKDDNLACMRKVQPLVGAGKVTREMLVKFGQDRMCDLLDSLRPSG